MKLLVNLLEILAIMVALCYGGSFPKYCRITAIRLPPWPHLFSFLLACYGWESSTRCAGENLLHKESQP